MPWKEVNPMQQRVFFITDYLRQTMSLSGLCAQYGVSRKTGYKWIERYRSLGLEGLTEASSRPLHSPDKTPYRIEQSIIELRQQFMDPPGSKKIHTLLARHYPVELIPSKTTIYNILNRAGLVETRRRKRRVSPYPQPFAPVHQVNELWSVDYKGQFKLRSGQWCYPLTVMDHQSRYLCGCEALKGPLLKDTKAVFIKVFREYGLPWRIRSDNGTPFASTSCGGLSRLSIWWLKLNILPERIEPGKPQQNGQHERMHRTLKRAATRPPSTSMRAQQQQFDRFSQEYNHQRPHESLDQQTPASQYSASTRSYPERLPEIEYPIYYETRQVRYNGLINLRNKQVYISNLLHHETIGLEEIDDGLWCVYFGPIKIGEVNERQKTGKTESYLSIKV
jgi:putative transposase